MTHILVINGPNLNNLGKRDKSHYGNITLDEINAELATRGAELSLDVQFCQSNHEGELIDRIQRASSQDALDGIILNAGALTQSSYALLDALLDAGVPFIEVHISNIHGREPFRRNSVFAPYAVGQIAGLGWHGYRYALEHMAGILK